MTIRNIFLLKPGKVFVPFIVSLLFLTGFTTDGSGRISQKKEADGDCLCKGIALHGKVKFVTSFPDLKINFVESFPDLKVKFVSSFPDDCGEWEIVESFPDFKVQVVESFPDIKVKVVESFPGLP